MVPVVLAIAAISVAAFLAFRWFERYRYTEAWRHSEFRGVAFGFLMWFGGIFGHRVPPPPQAKVEFATKAGEADDPSSGGPSLPENAPNKEE